MNIIDSIMQSIVKKIKQKEAIIGIIGLGYVGLPLALSYCRAGYKVFGFDIDKKKVDILNNKKTYIQHIPFESISNAIDQGFFATTDYSKISDVDAIIICVPTPLTKQKEPDLSYLRNTVSHILPYLKKQQIISLESTTYPGTTEDELVAHIEKRSLTIGSDYHVVYSPEREDPGNKDFTTHKIPKIIGGHTTACVEVGIVLYQDIIEKVIPVSSLKTAEMVKLLENIYRSVNIGLVNEMKMIADKMNIDIYEVIHAAASKPFGFAAHYPGPGVGGHCIPIDPFYLTWKAKEYGIHTRFIELSGEINRAMPNYIVQKTMLALNKYQKSLKGSKVLMLGLSYKKNVDDARESPSVEIMEILRSLDVTLSYSDPFFPIFPLMREHRFNLTSVDISPESLKLFDCVILATDHDCFNYNLIKDNAQLIIDTRGKYKESFDHIIKA